MTNIPTLSERLLTTATTIDLLRRMQPPQDVLGLVPDYIMVIDDYDLWNINTHHLVVQLRQIVQFNRNAGAVSIDGQLDLSANAQRTQMLQAADAAIDLLEARLEPLTEKQLAKMQAEDAENAEALQELYDVVGAGETDPPSTPGEDGIPTLPDVRGPETDAAVAKARESDERVPRRPLPDNVSTLSDAESRELDEMIKSVR